MIGRTLGEMLTDVDDDDVEIMAAIHDDLAGRDVRIPQYHARMAEELRRLWAELAGTSRPLLDLEIPSSAAAPGRRLRVAR